MMMNVPTRCTKLVLNANRILHAHLYADSLDDSYLVMFAILYVHRYVIVKKQPSQDVLYGDAAEEELGLAHLVSSYTLPHQNSQPGGRGQQTARSKVLSRRARDT